MPSALESRVERLEKELSRLKDVNAIEQLMSRYVLLKYSQRASTDVITGTQ